MNTTVACFTSLMAVSGTSFGAGVCDHIQLASHLIHCWCVNDSGLPQNQVISNLKDAIQRSDSGLVQSTYYWCAAQKGDSAKEQYINCRVFPESFLQVAKHTVSCYEPRPSAKGLTPGESATREGKELGLDLCVPP